VILNYSRTWTLLQGYDEDSLKVEVEPKEAKFILDFDEAKEAIAQFKGELVKLQSYLAEKKLESLAESCEISIKLSVVLICACQHRRKGDKFAILHHQRASV